MHEYWLLSPNCRYDVPRIVPRYFKKLISQKKITFKLLLCRHQLYSTFHSSFLDNPWKTFLQCFVIWATREMFFHCSSLYTNVQSLNHTSEHPSQPPFSWLQLQKTWEMFWNMILTFCDVHFFHCADVSVPHGVLSAK